MNTNENTRPSLQNYLNGWRRETWRLTGSNDGTLSIDDDKLHQEKTRVENVVHGGKIQELSVRLLWTTSFPCRLLVSKGNANERNLLYTYWDLLTVFFIRLVIVVTKSTPDLLKTELRLHVVVHVFSMNLWNTVFVLEFLSAILLFSFVRTQLI